jgi:rhodanese-related sulfurtransferase
MNTVIVDVRSRKEFNEGSYPGALNIPAEQFDVSEFLPFKNDNIALVCFSGNRASKIKSNLEAEGFSHVSLLQNQIVNIEEGSLGSSSIWTVDRQFRLALGLLIGIFLIGNYIFNTPKTLIVLLIVFSGLIYSAITDNCYLKIFIVWLPWNRKKNYERPNSMRKLTEISF